MTSLPRLSPRARGRIAVLATSVLTSGITAPVALWALKPPQQFARLWLAIGVCVLALWFGVLIGRSVTRGAEAEERNRGE